MKNNTVSGFNYTPDDHRGHGRAALSERAGTFTASGNKFAGNEVNIYGATAQRAGGHVKP